MCELGFWMFLLIIIVLLYLLIKWLMSNKEFFDVSQQPEMINYYTTWCHHSMKFLPIWKEFKFCMQQTISKY